MRSFLHFRYLKTKCLVNDATCQCWDGILQKLGARAGNSSGWDGHSARIGFVGPGPRVGFRNHPVKKWDLKKPFDPLKKPEKGPFFFKRTLKWNPTMNFQEICWFLRECTHFIGNFVVWPTVGNCHVYITDRNWDFTLQNVATIGEYFYTVFVVNGERGIHTPSTIPQVLCKFLDTHLE